MPKASSFSRFTRGVKHTVRAFASTKHPVLVHIVPMRRCNLSCTYCNEYDKTSEPVPIGTMLERIDKLAEFGTSVVTISGGEPMMHPEIYEIIARIRHHGMIAGLISNGYYFQPEKVKKLNEAGLDYLQISIDNVTPDEVSKKSLKVLDAKLVNLRDHAKFKVNINSVVGGGVANPDEALIIANRARELGFSSTVGVIHDGDGPEQGPDAARKRGLQRDQEQRLALVRPLELVSGRSGRRRRIRMALPCRCALSLHRRERHRQLVLAAARHARNPASRIHPRRHGARIHHRKMVRPDLHYPVRPPGRPPRRMARPANFTVGLQQPKRPWTEKGNRHTSFER